MKLDNAESFGKCYMDTVKKQLNLDSVPVPMSYLPWPSAEKERIYINKFVGDKPVSPHRHEFIELVVIERGACFHRYNGTEVPIMPGDAFIVFPDEEHSYSISKETVIYNCLFYPQALGEDWERVKEFSGIYNFIMVEPYYRSETGKQEIIHLSPEELEFVERILEGMIEEQNMNSRGKDIYLKASMMHLLVFMGRVWEKQFSDQMRLFQGKKDILNEALSYIEQNINSELKVSELASLTYLSAGHFRKVFKDSTGLTPMEYINTLRVSKAVQHLKEGKCTVAEVAELVGISDPNYFTRLFKKVTGHTPKGAVEQLHCPRK